jgi:hypothetical protein
VIQQTLNARLQYAIYDASGRFEMNEAPPSLEEAQRRLDEALEAEPEAVELDQDRELLELMMGGA